MQMALSNLCAIVNQSKICHASPTIDFSGISFLYFDIYYLVKGNYGFPYLCISYKIVGHKWNSFDGSISTTQSFHYLYWNDWLTDHHYCRPGIWTAVPALWILIPDAKSRIEPVCLKLSSLETGWDCKNGKNFWFMTD